MATDRNIPSLHGETTISTLLPTSPTHTNSARSNSDAKASTIQSPTEIYYDATKVFTGSDGPEKWEAEESVPFQQVNLVTALAHCKPNPWTPTMFKLYIYMFVACLNSAINGYDGSLMGGINAMTQYHDYFDVQKEGHIAGLIFATYTLGNVIGSFFSGPFSDKYGRRWGMFIGASIILLGAGVQASSTTRAMFIGGRFVLGFGVATCQTAGPSYAAEIAHPAWRGTLTGIYNGFFYLGAIPAFWTLYGTEVIQSTASWRIPIWLQTVASGGVLVGCLFCPETPRWLFANGRPAEARSVLAKYHGEGNRDSPVVILEMYEMMEEIEMSGADKRWWDYRDLFRTKNAWWRMACVLGMGIFGQWSGNAALSYFMPILLGELGIKSERTQLLCSAIWAMANWVAAMVGARFTDRIGRRKLLLTVTSSFVFWWTLIIIMHNFRSKYPEDTEKHKIFSIAAISFMYVFGVTYSFGYTPLQILYPVECLQYETRAKGMAMYNLSVNLSLLLSMYTTPVALAKIGFKLFYLYIGWDCLEVLFIYTFFVETKELTLEEINEIFEAPNPKKKSLEPRIVVQNPNFDDINWQDLKDEQDARYTMSP
ncbi:hypothetical protein TWF225_011481 [Orbilia oligospora]|nr:hypothetical protein TWF225_011481 [Orbilia oligospora]KAF3170811.1 hypothetical protein TWF751_006639 [Orbilia oligospora]KAF3246724.1 hypothetical protein TWF128_008841 [Orbilia oligospora]KAF3257845.1 hypothetical protein TWF217_005949 [Orbilia oligospora]KAF3281420.1 hypothetical protein TWF132_011190 [Orbilia oligospora]